MIMLRCLRTEKGGDITVDDQTIYIGGPNIRPIILTGRRLHIQPFNYQGIDYAEARFIARGRTDTELIEVWDALPEISHRLTEKE